MENSIIQELNAEAEANPDFQESKTEEKKSTAERKSDKHYHFNNCTFNFKEPQ